MAPFLQLHQTFSVESSWQHRAPIGPDPSQGRSQINPNISSKLEQLEMVYSFKEYHGYT